MILQVLNVYSTISHSKNTLFEKIRSLGEFQLNKYTSLAERAEKLCNISCMIFAVFVSLSFLIFHPILGHYCNLPTIYFVDIINISKIFMNTLLFLLFGLIIYMQLFAIFNPFYTISNIYIHYLELKEYIETNLCKHYDDFEIINSEAEQEVIYEHLKKCIKIHLLLKK